MTMLCRFEHAEEEKVYLLRDLRIALPALDKQPSSLTERITSDHSLAMVEFVRVSSVQIVTKVDGCKRCLFGSRSQKSRVQSTQNSHPHSP